MLTLPFTIYMYILSMIVILTFWSSIHDNGCPLRSCISLAAKSWLGRAQGISYPCCKAVRMQVDMQVSGKLMLQSVRSLKGIE